MAKLFGTSFCLFLMWTSESTTSCLCGTFFQVESNFQSPLCQSNGPLDSPFLPWFGCCHSEHLVPAALRWASSSSLTVLFVRRCPTPRQICRSRTKKTNKTELKSWKNTNKLIKLGNWQNVRKKIKADKCRSLSIPEPVLVWSNFFFYKLY